MSDTKYTTYFQHPVNILSLGNRHLGKIKGRKDYYIGDQYLIPINTSIYPISQGIVDKIIPWDGNWGFGNHIFVKHYLSKPFIQILEEKYGIITDVIYSHYANLKTIEVEEDSLVDKNTVLGKSGCSGINTYLLHIDIRKSIFRGYFDNPSFLTKKWIKENYIPPYEFMQHVTSPKPKDFIYFKDLLSREIHKKITSFF